MATGRTPLAEFLRARRELLQPEDVGIERDEPRRVPGLRREEVAALAGISAEYYLRLEQGRDHQPSEQVLSALGRALLLDETSQVYLHRLAHPVRAARPVRTRRGVGDGVLRLLEQWSHTPAYVSDRNQDVLAVNPPAAELAPGYLVPGNNLLLATFRERAAAGRKDLWTSSTLDMLAALRFHADPADPRFQEIVGSLSVGDREFRRMWALHDARPQTTGTIASLVDGFGWIEFRWQTLEIPGVSGQFLTTFFGDPGSEAATVVQALAVRTRGRRTRTLDEAQASLAPAATSARRVSAT
ncbi:helix-turn-helix domain-containing protein [Amnibacterium flavum]|uniref:XRE family transcriptional regulator n=1 Tax=Amnibacterium flavum TaxID=2173173 RepID=A0A2V1HSW7_9MICO|nr:helix-turn-helix transcriptional regulator [Amnibacterium flavum]PVZ93417.1 XRE family transcriptional regulator [Amnibacterium flavum]